MIDSRLLIALEAIAEYLGAKPRILEASMCEVRARAWARETRETNDSTGKPGTGANRRAARLPISGVEFLRGTAVLIPEGTSIAVFAAGLGLKTTVVQPLGVVLSIDPAARN